MDARRVKVTTSPSYFAMYCIQLRSRLDSSCHHLLFAHVSRARRTFELDRYIGIAISSVVAVPVSCFFNKVTSQGSTHERAAAEIIPRSAFTIVIWSVGRSNVSINPLVALDLLYSSNDNLSSLRTCAYKIMRISLYIIKIILDLARRKMRKSLQWIIVRWTNVSGTSNLFRRFPRILICFLSKNAIQFLFLLYARYFPLYVRYVYI